MKQQGYRRRVAYTCAAAATFAGLATIGAPAAFAQSTLTCPSPPQTPTSTKKSPYASNSPFRAALDRVQRLQFPTSGECLDIEEIRDNKIVRNHFWMNTANQLVFQMLDVVGKRRVELRGNTFAKSASGPRMNFTYTIPNTPASGRSTGFTIGQLITEVVGDGSAVPIVRLEVIDQRNEGGGVINNNHLYAVYKSSDSSDTVYRSLGPVADAGVNGFVALTYNNSNGKIYVSHSRSGLVKGASFNLPTAPQANSGLYFKTGCYTQDDGDCQVIFSALSYTNVAAVN